MELKGCDKFCGDPYLPLLIDAMWQSSLLIRPVLSASMKSISSTNISFHLVDLGDASCADSTYSPFEFADSEKSALHS